MKSLKRFNPTREQKEACWRAFEPFVESYRREFLSVALCTLAKQNGFGKIRLIRFIRDFGNTYDHNKRFYSYERDDAIWVCQNKLKTDYGIDIEEIEKELASEPPVEAEEKLYSEADIMAVMKEDGFEWSRLRERLRAYRGEGV